MITERAIRAINVIRVLTRFSWDVTPYLLLVAYRYLVQSTLEWVSPLFSSACRETLRLLDRAQYMALRAVLGCMRSTPISIFLSESGETLFELERHLLSNPFIVRNFFWRGNPLIPKLRLFSERSTASPRFRLLRLSLVSAYRGLVDVLGVMAHPVRPGYFDWPWESVVVPVSIDLTSVYDFTISDDPNRACTEFLARCYPDYDIIYTDGVVGPASGRVGCGCYAGRDNFRYGLKLQVFTSVLSSELYVILRAIYYSGRSAMGKVLIFPDS